MKRIPYTEPNQAERIRITRIDLSQANDGLIVNKYAAGWTASTPPVSHTLNREWALADAVAWLRENGWTVRTWKRGARAWLGEMLPVRNRGAILRRRRQLALHPDPELNVHALDLAYDL